MNAKQTLMLIISIVLCLAVYPFYDIAFAIMILLTATTAVVTLMGDSRAGLIPAVLSIIGAVIFYFSFGTEYITPGVLTAVASLAGFVMGLSIRGKWALQGILFFSGGVFLAAIMAAVFAINKIYDADIINQVITNLKEVAYDTLLLFGMATSGTAADIKSMVDTAYDYITTLVPSVLILTCAGMAYISFGIARYILKKNKIILPMIPDRRHLIMSRGSGWIMIMVWLLNLFVENERIGYALTNISVIISTLFLICGISLALHLIEYRVKPEGIKWLLRAVVFTSMFSAGSMLISELYVMAAIIDSVWNFRKIGPAIHQ